MATTSTTTTTPADIQGAIARREAEAVAKGQDYMMAVQRGGHTLAALNAAFSAIEDPTDWRAPVDAIIRPDDCCIVYDAIEWVTATRAEFEYLPELKLMRVRAIGYRMGPAGP